MQLASEDCTGTTTTGCATQRRYTRTYWTQDNTSLAYVLNPRVTDSRVSNGINTKRTTIDYWLENDTSGPAIFGLVKSVFVYDSDLSTILKKTYTTYNMDSAYVSRRVIGLPSMTKTYGLHGSNLISKVTYDYDHDDDFAVSGLNQNITATHHDNTNYGASFSAGRGNLTKTTRWNVDYDDEPSLAIKTQTIYNVAGSPVAQITPWFGSDTRTVRIGYSDLWNDTESRPATYAYPTVVTDPSTDTLGHPDHSSTVKYRYDIGANVEGNSPAPEGNEYGKRTTRTYDTKGRLSKDLLWRYDGPTSTWKEHSYTRYEYPENGIQHQVFTTPTETTTTLGPDTADEVLAETFTDGVGRIRRSRVPHTFTSGNPATWAGTKTEYDILGRVISQSIPTEVDGGFDPTGDDSVFLWTHQEYDWMNRVVRKINTGDDPQQQNPSDVLITYEGCGCAGATTTTIQGEQVPIPDSTNSGRRTQKIYQDILGRTTKVETFDWSGAVYSTTVHAYNDRDQVTSTTQYAGTTSGSSQVTTMSYDGHGLLLTRHIPQQSANTYTSYLHNPDGTVAQVTDARGAATYYSYNSRGLVSHIGYTVPGNSGIPESPNVEFEYDNAGNRIEMDDGLGTVTYTYNSLSQLTAELRNFDDELLNAPEANNGYKFDYTYHMGGQLKSLTEPFGATVNYGLDKLGRLSSVTPSAAYGSTSTFASNAQYRAFGGLKHLEYGNGVVMNTTFNNRQQPATFTLGTSGTTVMQKAYQYNADDRLKYVDDQLNWKFDRLNVYDHQGRLQYGKSSSEANGTEITNGWEQVQNLPYRQSNGYNAFNKLTSRYNKQWGGDMNQPITYTFTNDRITGASNGYVTWTNYQYDADGRMVTSDWPDGISETKYDASGQLVFRHYKQAPGEVEDKTTKFLNGNGQEEKRTGNECRIILPEDPEDPCVWQGETTGYYLRSTVLGGEVVTTAGIQGVMGGRSVWVGGEKLADLHFAWSNNVRVDAAQFYHMDPMRVSQRVTRNSPETLLGTDPYNPSYIDSRHSEFDPRGQNVGTVTNYVQQPAGPSEPPIPIEGQSPLYIDGQRVSFSLDGMSISSQMAQNLMQSLGGAYSFQITNSSLPAIYRLGNFRGIHGEGVIHFGNDRAAAEDWARRNGEPYGVIRATLFVTTQTFWGWAAQGARRDIKKLPKSLSEASRRKHPDRDRLKNDLNSRLDIDNGNGSCRDKLNGLLNELGSSFSSIDQLAEKYLSGDFPLFETKENVPSLRVKVGKTWERVDAPSGATVFDGRRNEITMNRGVVQEGFTFIHELLHAAGRGAPFSHREIADAVRRLEGRTDWGENNFIGAYCQEKNNAD